MKHLKLLAALFFILNLFTAAGPLWAGEEAVNALLLLSSADTAFDQKFQDYLNKNGARLLDSYPPSVFIGFIPQGMDRKLGDVYGVTVYRDKVTDLAAFALHGDKAVMAVNVWNKRFQEDPPEAPMVVSTKVRRAGKKGDGIELCWNQVMKAVSYRLQISPAENFARIPFDLVIPGRACYTLFPAFWDDGVYYWRVAGIQILNTGYSKEGTFSRPDSFAVSKPALKGKGARPMAQAMPEEARLSTNELRWGPGGYPYYRFQLSETPDFILPLADVFTDTCTYNAAALPIKSGGEYYVRIMASDGSVSSKWSEVSKIVYEPVKRKSGYRKRPGRH